MIYGLFRRRKCANGVLFLPFRRADSALDFSKKHLRNVAHGIPQYSSGLRRVEISDPSEHTRLELLGGIHAAPRQNHEGHAVLREKPQAVVQIVVIQVLKQAAILCVAEHGGIV